jgi:septal ring factor EnvC (AmiA/AmiB activator)
VFALAGCAVIRPGPVDGAQPGSAATAQPASSQSVAAPRASREAATRAKLAGVRARIAKIAAAQHATSARRKKINAQLAAQATQLDRAARALERTDAAISAQIAALAKLQQKHAGLKATLAGQKQALAELLRAVYALDRGSSLSLLLGSEDIAKVNRMLAYSRYFQRDRMQRIHRLLDEVVRLDTVEDSIKAKTAALEQQRDEQTKQRARLQQARVAQHTLLAAADAQLAHQQDKLTALHHHADALNALLKRLKNVFADIPKQIGNTPPFAKLRGKLPWPVAGKPRKRSIDPAHGIVIAAKPGAVVRAVAYGRVAWADFMRGYGMLVIVDQGNGWMSLYGGNEAVLVEVGDWVKPGQPIARVAADSARGGAWFGLRHDGKPVKPNGWFDHKR